MTTRLHADLLRKPDSVRTLQVATEHVGQRIDNFLLRELKGLPKSRVYRILRRGEVRVNGSRVKPDYRLCSGDRLRIPPLRLEHSEPLRPPDRVMDRLSAAVLYEDDDIIALNKPSGLAVHRGSGLGYGLIEALRMLRPQQGFLELVHRLDRDTSGCLLLAKTPEGLRAAHDALRSGTADKRYLALVRGRWERGSELVRLPLSRDLLRGGERVVAVNSSGRPALTRFVPVTIRAEASLLEAVIGTGRTHQIRVHAAALGHPVAGDDKYGDSGFNQHMKILGLKRLFLHAHSLSMPLRGREITVSAPLNPDLQQVLELISIAS